MSFVEESDGEVTRHRKTIYEKENTLELSTAKQRRQTSEENYWKHTKDMCA